MALVKSSSQSTTEDIARYIGGMARELRSLAGNAELGFLAYLLSMVEHEAAAAAASGKVESGTKPGDDEAR